jgi:hypothetical protein
MEWNKYKKSDNYKIYLGGTGIGVRSVGVSGGEVEESNKYESFAEKGLSKEELLGVSFVFFALLPFCI